MANHKLDDKILIRALKQFLYCDSQKQAAHELGLPMTTYRSHIDMGKRKFKISEEEYWAREFAHKLPNDMMFEIDSETIEEKEDMSRFILDVNDEFGTTVALIEHDMGVVMDIADRVVVMDYGKKIGDDTPENILKNQAVIDAYLGVANE